MSKLLRILALAPLLLIGGCGGDDAPEAPAGFAVTAGDARVQIEWDYLANLTYDLWWKEGAGVVARELDARSMSGIVWPALASFWTNTVSGTTTTYYLENDRTYSFVMNARNGGSPASASTPSLTATPRYAGEVWTQKNAAGAAGSIPSGVTLKGVASNAHLIVNDGKSDTNPLFVAVGDGGAIHVASNAADWAAVSSGVTQNLNAVTYGINAGSSYYFVAVGDAGTILRCNYDNDDDAACTSWSAASSVPVSSNLNDVVAGEAIYVAVGDDGVILTSSDGHGGWTQRTSGTAAHLYGVNYAYDEDLDDGYFIAVGAGGTILTSTDGTTWTARTSGTTQDLYALTYGIDRSVTASDVYYYVAVGAAGTVISAQSPSGTWTDQTAYSGTTDDLYTVAKGTRSRFIAAGANGTLIYSLTPGANWTSVSTGSSAQINKLMYIWPVMLPSYLAIGEAGSNWLSK